MVHRSLLRMLVVVLLGVALAAPVSVAAGQATPDAEAVNPFAELGLPQLDITVTESAYEGVPSELEAGRYVVAVSTELEEGGGGGFLQIPDEVGLEAFLELAAPMAEGSPMAEDAAAMEASPAAEGGDMAPPPWYYETAMAGGPYADAGTTAYAVVELTAGQWVWWAEYPGAPQAPVPVTVSGEAPADQPTPEADVTVEMSDFAFGFSGPLTAGDQVIEVVNVGEQPHFILIVKVPDGTTEDDVMALLEMEMAGMEGAPMATPAEGGLAFEDTEDVFGSADQSAGVTAWYTVSLEPGTHVALCFVTDPETGMPHVMLGMVEVFEVE